MLKQSHIQLRENRKTFKTLEAVISTSLKMLAYIHFDYCDAFRVLAEKKESPESKGEFVQSRKTDSFLLEDSERRWFKQRYYS